MNGLQELAAHPAIRAYGGTVIAYGLILAVMTALFFILPYLIFRAL